MTTTIRQAIHTVIRDAASVTSLLGNGANSVHVSGRVPPSGPFPCLAIRRVGRFGGARRLPFYEDLFYITCYDNALSAQAASYYNIDRVLNAVRKVIHGALLTLSGDSEQVFYCFLDNFDSPDLWDGEIEKPYASVRIRVPGVYGYDYRS